MLIRGKTTEDRIGEIANRFSQGISGLGGALQQQANQDLQMEAMKRQQALQALDTASSLSEKTGKMVTPDMVAPLLKSGDFSGIGEVLKSAPVTPKYQQALDSAELDKQYKQSQINKNNASAQKSATGASGKGSIAEQSVDRNFAKTYDDFIVGGGYTKVDRGLKALKNVSAQLGSKGADLTGPLTGRTPDLVQSFINPKAIETRDSVGTIIQDNLKSILGASYTEAEGERVIKRAYDPTLSEAANKKKLDSLINQMESAAKAKLEAAKYFEQNGSMRGYKGTVINSVDDVFNHPVTASNPSAVQGHLKTAQQMSDAELIQKAKELGVM